MKASVGERVVSQGGERSVTEKRGRRTGHQRVTPYLYVLPALLFVGGFLYYGIGFNINISGYEWNGLSANRTPVGLDNYRRLLTDTIFLKAFGNTMLFAVLTIPLQMYLALRLATLLSAPIRFRGFFQAVIILPSITAPAIVALVARRVFDARAGEMNALLDLVGLDGLQQAWLANPSTVLFALMVAHVWQWTGFGYILYYSALSLVGREVIESATIDGASNRQMFWRIVVPLVKPTHWALAILGVIQTLKLFEIVYLTTRGGPGRASEVVSTFLFKAGLLDLQAGYSAAVAVVVVIVSLALTVAQFAVYNRSRLT